MKKILLVATLIAVTSTTQLYCMDNPDVGSAVKRGNQLTSEAAEDDIEYILRQEALKASIAGIKELAGITEECPLEEEITKYKTLLDLFEFMENEAPNDSWHTKSIVDFLGNPSRSDPNKVVEYYRFIRGFYIEGRDVYIKPEPDLKINLLGMSRIVSHNASDSFLIKLSKLIQKALKENITFIYPDLNKGFPSDLYRDITDHYKAESVDYYLSFIREKYPTEFKDFVDKTFRKCIGNGDSKTGDNHIWFILKLIKTVDISTDNDEYLRRLISESRREGAKELDFWRRCFTAIQEKYNNAQKFTEFAERLRSRVNSLFPSDSSPEIKDLLDSLTACSSSKQCLLL